MIIRPLGHIRDFDHHVDEDVRTRHVAGLLVGGPTTVATSFDQRSLFSPKDQSPANACVGCAMSRSI